ncbi:hypothetical protein [Kangiella sp.]|uniref:hypothetical protein n=1 Tax=Kangiella sp. TaxID=1920245 RepID=UPI003A8CFEE9
MNFGFDFICPFESDVSLRHHLIKCNPLYSNPQLNLLTEAEQLNHHKGQAKLITKYMQWCEKSKYTGVLRPEEYRRFPTRLKPKSCPDCAKIGFYSHFYNYVWMKRCPIHNKRLTKYCQACKKGWLDSLSKDNKCTKCQVDEQYYNYLEARVIAKNSSKVTLVRIYELIQKCKDNSKNRLVYSDELDSELSHFIDITQSKLFPSYLIKEDLTSSKSISAVASKTYALHKQSFQLDNNIILAEPITYDDLKKIPKLKDSIIKATTRANKVIRQSLETLDPSLTLLPFITHAKVRFCCPYCMAYSCWMHLIESSIKQIDKSVIIHSIAAYVFSEQKLKNPFTLATYIKPTDKTATLIEELSYVTLLYAYVKIHCMFLSAFDLYYNKNSDLIFIYEIDECMRYSRYKVSFPLELILDTHENTTALLYPKQICNKISLPKWKHTISNKDHSEMLKVNCRFKKDKKIMRKGFEEELKVLKDFFS